jgi:beta-phosphoglucomutase
MSLFKLAIFDLDGVITNTTEAHFKAWAYLFKTRFNILLNPQLEKYTKGVSRQESLKVLLNHYGIKISAVEQFKMTQIKNEHYQRLITSFDHNNLMPGVIECLSYFRNKGIKIALGSASQSGPLLIQKLGIEMYFDYIVNPKDKKGKPAPDIFLDACYYFGFKPSECIAFEDAIAGVKAIKSANMFAVGVGNEPFENVDLIVTNLQALTAERLDTLIN